MNSKIFNFNKIFSKSAKILLPLFFTFVVFFTLPQQVLAVNQWKFWNEQVKGKIPSEYQQFIPAVEQRIKSGTSVVQALRDVGGTQIQNMYSQVREKSSLLDKFQSAVITGEEKIRTPITLFGTTQAVTGPIAIKDFMAVAKTYPEFKQNESAINQYLKDNNLTESSTVDDLKNAINGSKQKIFDAEMAIGDASSQVDDMIEKVEKGESMYGLMEIAGKIPAVLSLVEDIKNIGKGKADIGTIMSTIQKAGGIFGFEVPGEFSQMAGMFGGMSNGMSDMASNIGGMLTQGIAGKSGSQLSSMAAGGIPGVKDAMGGGGGVQDLATQTDDMQQKAEDPKGSDVCNQNGDKANKSGGGGGNGVPVIEQPGDLLSNTEFIAENTGTLVDLTTKIKGISQKTCEMVQKILEIQIDLQKKEREDDPAAAEKARDAIKKEKEEFEKRMQEGRKPSNQGSDGQAKSSFYPTVLEYTKEELESIGVKYLQNIDDSDIHDSIKKPILQAFEQKVALSNDPDAAYKARVAPTPGFDPGSVSSKEGDELLDGIVTLSKKENNISGQVLINQSEMEKIQSKRFLESIIEWVTYQIMPETECSKWAEYGGKKTCIEKKIITPAKWVADQGSAFATTKLRMTENTDEHKEDEESPLGNGGSSVTGTTAETTGQSRGEVPSQPNTGGGSNKKSGVFDYANQFSDLLSDGFLDKLFGGGGNQNEEEDYYDEEEYEEEPLPPAPLPIITFGEKTLTNDPITGVRKTKITWNVQNAYFCLAGNDWLSYGSENEATTTPSITIKKHDDIDDKGNFEIFHPAIFRYNISASGPSTQGGAIPQNPTMTLGLSAGSLAQTIIYTPNINGLSANDSIFLTLNGHTISIPANTEDDTPNAKDITERLKIALENESIQAKANEFSQYTKTIQGNSLRLTRTARNVAQNDYSITCYGADRREVTRSTRVTF